MQANLEKSRIDDEMIKLEADTKGEVIVERAVQRKKAIDSMVENEVEKLY